MNFMYGLCFAVAAPAILSQAAAGIGVTLGINRDNIVVKSLIPDSAAALNKEIHIGDRIIAVAQNNDAPAKLQGLTLTEAVALIRGPKGTTVRLTIVPEGEDDTQARVVSLVRGEIKTTKGDGVLAPFDPKSMPPEVF